MRILKARYFDSDGYHSILEVCFNQKTLFTRLRANCQDFADVERRVRPRRLCQILDCARDALITVDENNVGGPQYPA
jgi:hypothetical protein